MDITKKSHSNFSFSDDINAPKQQHCNNAYEEQFKEVRLRKMI